MRTLQIISEHPISKDCNIIYTSIAFDGTNIYLSNPEYSKIHIFNLCMDPVCTIDTNRKYVGICYDFELQCFWGYTEKNCTKLYKLNKSFQEIGYLCIHTGKDVKGAICGISLSCSCNNLYVAYSDKILEISKENGAFIRILEKCSTCLYHSVASCCDFYASSYEKCCSSYLSIYCPDGTAIINCCLEDCYEIKSMTMIYCQSDYQNNCCIYAIASKNNIYYLIKFKLVQGDKCCDCISDCCEDHCNNNCSPTLNDIIESIALVEASIAHILNAEGEKIQKALASTNNIHELLEVNNSVCETITYTTQLEHVLFAKLDAAINHKMPFPPHCNNSCDCMDECEYTEL